MKKNRKQYTPEFKAKIALTALRGKYTVKEIAAHFDVHPSLVHAWRQALADLATSLFPGQGGGRDKPCELRAMDRAIEELRAEQEWMRRAIAGMRLHDKRSCIDADSKQVSILGQARLLGLHRSGIYYKSRKNKETPDRAGPGNPSPEDRPGMATDETPAVLSLQDA